MQYFQREENVPFEVDLENGWSTACCDCGLVHTFTFKKIRGGGGYRFKVTVVREYRSTGQLRRHKAGDLHTGVGGWRMVRGE